MKALPFKIPKTDNYALTFQEDQGTRFYDRFHQHEEIQISIILDGEGDLIVGDTVCHFAPNDVLILDGNMPHLFRSDPTDNGNAHMLSLFFTKDSFGKDFFGLSELRSLETLFRQIESGIKMQGGQSEIKSLFLEIKNASPLERLILFLKLLQHIHMSPSAPLASYVSTRSYTETEGERMNNVLNHTVNHFGREVTLQEIAEIAHLTPNAFCRYFKQRTRKTYFQFLMEVRLEHACRLLRKQPDLSVLEVSEASGFRNISNFNRKFKAYKGVTPTVFRKNKT